MTRRDGTIRNRLSAVVAESLVATGRAATARIGEFQIERDFPVAKPRASGTGELRAIGGMRLVAEPAAPALALVDNVEVMEIPAAIAEFGINRGIGVFEHVFLVTFQARIIKPLCVGCINFSGIVAG